MLAAAALREGDYRPWALVYYHYRPQSLETEEYYKSPLETAERDGDEVQVAINAWDVVEQVWQI